jgi:trehalose synthase
MDGFGIEKYAGVVDGHMLAEIQRRARAIYGLRVLHVNSTYHGGGVAGLLSSLVPLMNDVGINADWNLLYGDPALFAVTKKLHNGLQGEDVTLSEEELEAYLCVNRMFALYSPIVHDVVIVHDPQPLPMIRFRLRENPWVWRCHIDVSSPNESVEKILGPFVMRYDAMVVSSEDYRRPNWPLDAYIIAPAIDPFSETNRDATREEVAAKLAEYGIRDDKPLITQVSRFDKWKDPLGVIKTFEKVLGEVDCRLVLLGNMATDDPEGPMIFQQVKEIVEQSPNIQLITENDPLLVNALQRRADAVLQLSLREGFGLTVSEALWKGTPVVATRVGGIPLQVTDGKMGYLVDPRDYDAAAEKVVDILQHPSRKEEFGAAGREHVRKNYLTPRLLFDWLGLLGEVA